MKKILIPVAVVVVLAVGAVVGFVIYTNSTEQDETSLADTGAERDVAPDLAGSPDGKWAVAEGSQGGYRVENEILQGATVTATGYTSDLAGSMTLTGGGAAITEASFTIDVPSITSDGFARRDNAFREVLAADEFPTASFELTEPIGLAAFPDENVETKIEVIGELTLKGSTNAVTFTATAVRGGNRIDVKALIPVTYTEFGIKNPSNSFAQITDSGFIDVSIGFTKG